MRIENSARNGVFGILRTISQLIMKFIVRTVFIKVLGEELLGLDSLFSSILQVLSLAELGFGSAIVYSMYKPIAENDANKVAALLFIYKKIYLIVGSVVFIIGAVLTPFVPYLISGQPPIGINIYVVFIIFLLNTSIGYFFAYKRSLLYANQRNDIESKISCVMILLLNAIQIICLLLTKNYYIFIMFMPIFTIIENVAVTLAVNKMFPMKYNGEKLEKSDKIALRKSMTAMIGHKIGGVVVFSTDNILISVFLGLSVVGMYNNYYLLVAAIMSFINIFIKSITASVGNSVVMESVDKNYKNFIDLSFVIFWIVGFCTACFLALYQPFISLWLGDKLLLNDLTVLCIVISFMFNATRGIVGVYKETTGTFYNDRFKPFFEAGVNLIVSIILVQFMGLPGIIIGTIVSTVFIAIPMEIWAVFKNYFHKSLTKYVIYYLCNILMIVAVSIANWFLCSLLPSNGIWFFVAKSAISLVFPNVLFFLLSFWTPQFKYFKQLANSFFKKKSKMIK